MPYLGELLLQITLYPFIGIGIAFLLFMIVGKAWVFFLAPLIYWGLSTIAPLDPTFVPPDTPGIFSWPGAWFYWTHVFAVAVVYLVYRRTKKKRVWLFFLAPIIGWVAQFLGLFVVAPIFVS